MLQSLIERLRQCQTRDLHRFSQKIRFIERSNSTDSDLRKRISKLGALIDNSVSITESKDLLIPRSINFPESLPVSARASEIGKLLSSNQVIIVSGDTGSGKTTQLPKICLAAGYGRRGIVGHCQPRRLAATSVASRIASELNSQLGELVGYQVRFNERISESCCVKLMTDGILLSEIQSDPYLSKYEVIIVDEAHERSLNIDFLLGYLKRILNKRKELKLIITSATIDVEKFSSHFNSAQIIPVEGRTFPVETIYKEIKSDHFEKESSITDNVIENISSIISEPLGDISLVKDILVFLSSEREIKETAKALRKKKFTNTEILPLYARLPQSEQKKIFQAHKFQRIILCTNVAETSITVPGVKYVVDTGFARISRYSFQSKIQRLPIERISQASANQRKGRCGRTENGVCIRLYSEHDFNSRPLYTDPEIIRTNLAAVILKMLSLNLGDVFKFPFIEKPESKSINEGFKLLSELKAVCDQRKLTSDGRRMAALPVDPKHAKMLIVASSKNCLQELLIIVSVLSIQDPREVGFEELHDENQDLELFNNKHSDFLTLVNLWLIYEEKRKLNPSNILKKFCKKNSLSFIRMREWRETYLQLTLNCRKIGLRVNKKSGSYSDIHKSIIAGSLNQIAYKSSEKQYVGSRNRKFFVLNSSVLSKASPKWIVTGELIETSQTFATMAAKIEPRWVEEMALHVVKRQVYNPHWSVRNQRVQAFERIRLYGLTIIEKAIVEYSSTNPELAREIFINEGLAKSTLKTTSSFYGENQKVLESIQNEEEKLRRPELLVSETEISHFYSQVIPRYITSTKELEGWLKDPRNASLKDLNMSRETFLDQSIKLDTLDDFPDHFSINSNKISIDYIFDPGAKKDGATLKIPIQILNQLSDSDIDWAIPGMIRDRCIALLKGLPKATRKQLIPISGFVDEILPQILSLRGNLISRLSEALLKKRRLNISKTQLLDIKLPSHLVIKINVVDSDGRSLAVGSSLDKIKSYLNDQRVDFHVGQEEYPEDDSIFESKNLVDWVFDDLPEKIELNRDVVMVRYPGIVDNTDSVSLQLFAGATEALNQTKLGLVRLYSLRSMQQRNLVKKNFSRFVRESALLIPPNFSNFIDDAIHATYFNAFGIINNIPRTKSEFNRQLSEGKPKLYTQSQEILRIAKELFESRLVILRDLSPLRDTNLSYFYDDVRLQLDNLMTDKLFFEVGLDRLRQFPRYLKGIQFRLQKAPHLGAKDLLFTKEITKYWSEYENLRQIVASDEFNSLDEIRWMIEEYRVSLFAQSLGTKIPVSAKRIRKAIDILST